MLRNSLYEIFILAIPLLFVLVTHEFAHGFVALLNGDDTAKNHGRLSLNPLKHLDPLGTILLIIARFGWARPVPINPNNFKNRRLGMFFVSVAGIIINFFTAFIFIFIIKNFNIKNNVILDLITYTISFSLSFAIFNFIPIPPLDGSKILASFLPYKFELFISKFEKYSFYILIILVGTGFISKIMNPIYIYILNLFISIV